MRQKRYDTLLFDLDGTIVDSGPGIMRSVQYALDHFGLPDQPEEKLRRFIGPSLMDSFTAYYGMKEADARRAVEYYRECYDGSQVLNASLYQGIRDSLNRLQADGRQMVLVTTKPLVFAERILKHFHLDHLFPDKVCPELTDPSSDKGRLIRTAEEKAGFNPADAVMIGDTRYDMAGARETGVAAIGVTYGYGTPEELKQAGADLLVHSPAELYAALV